MTCILSKLSDVIVISDNVILKGCGVVNVSHNKIVPNSPHYFNLPFRNRTKFIRFSWDETTQFLQDLVDVSKNYIQIDVPSFVGKIETFMGTQEENHMLERAGVIPLLGTSIMEKYGHRIERPEPLTHININDNI